MARTRLPALIAPAFAAGCVTSSGGPRPALADKRPVSDSYHGVSVTEDYRWLEDWNDPAVKNWTDAQNTHAPAWLDALPGQVAIRERVEEILPAPTISYHALARRGGRLFAEKRAPPKQQPFLVVMDSWRTPTNGRSIVDPNEIDPSGGTSID